MDRNWLIRTKNLHILGPVSKTKIKELISNESIKGEDEVCSGNGYWFSIKEELLVQKYIHGDETQEFNPVSEAKSLRIMEQESKEETTQEDIQVGDITQVLNISSLQEIETKPTASNDDHEESKVPDEHKEFKVKPPVEEISKESNKAKKKRGSGLSGNFLYLILIFFFVLVVLGFYFRKRLLTEFLGHLTIIPQVHAQEFVVNPKKKIKNYKN